jgi:hypothetical protein
MSWAKRLHAMSPRERRQYEPRQEAERPVRRPDVTPEQAWLDCEVRMDRETCGMYLSAELADMCGF